MSATLAYVAAGLVGLWGVAHAIPTPQVVAGFEPITEDNRRVITQEWLAESFTMWGMAALLIVVTAVGDAGDVVVSAVYLVAAALLAAVAFLTATTGARTPVIWFKICVGLLGGTAVLLVIAALI